MNDPNVTQLFTSFRRIGLSVKQALSAAGGREHPFLKESDIQRNPSDEEASLEDSFRSMGLSESITREAAYGRGDLIDLKESNLEEAESEQADPVLIARAQRAIAEAESVLAEQNTYLEAQEAKRKSKSVTQSPKGEKNLKEIDLREGSMQVGGV